MKLFRSITLCMALMLSVQGTHATTTNDTLSEGIALVKNTAICAGLLAIPYFIGKGSSFIMLTMAQKRFNADISLLQRALQGRGTTMELYQSINAYYNQRLNTFFISKNDPLKAFPLIRYNNDLNFYINSLWCLQIFNLGSEQRTQIQAMVQDLTLLLQNITSWPQFTEELQRYEGIKALLHNSTETKQ